MTEPVWVDEQGRPTIEQDPLIEVDVDALFPFLERVPVGGTTEPVEQLSAGQRLTRRQRADVERGRHPLTRGPLTAVQGATCGSCRFRESGRYPKCLFGDQPGARAPRVTRGPATDVRAWWPGCTDWEAKP